MYVKLKEIPEELRKLILVEQAEMKAKCNCQFSQEKTVVMMLRKWGRIKNYMVNGVPMSKVVEEINLNG